MRRRALLSTLAGTTAALAGCQGSPDETPTNTTTTRTTTTSTTSTTTTTPPSDDAPTPPELGPGEATTAVLETGDRTLSLLDGHHRLPSGVVARAWLSATATPSHPATVTATITNDAEYPTGVRLGAVAPFTETPFARPSHDVDAGLYLVPTKNHEFATRVPEIARGDAFWYLDQSPGDWHPPTLELAAGETAVAELAVVTHYQHPGVFPTGRYEFGHGDGPLTLVAWQTSRPGPTTPSRFEGAAPPAFEDMDPRWYHEAGPQTPVYLEPSTERVATPGEVSFTVYNHSTDPLTGNYYDWSLHKQVAGDWYKIAPWVIPLPLTPIPPGGTHTHRLHVFNEAAVEAEGATALGFLGGGRYAFQVNLHRADGPTPAALFDLVASDVAVVPTDGVTTTRASDTITVTGPGYGDTAERDARLVVERADAAATRLLPEQVMRWRNQGLRNTLAFFEPGITRVELRTDDQVADQAAGSDDDPRRFRFEGDAFVATRG